MVNKWIKYVLAFQKKNNIKKYGAAMKAAGPSYRKQCGLKKKSPTKKRRKKRSRSNKKTKTRRSKSRKKRSKKTAYI